MSAGLIKQLSELFERGLPRPQDRAECRRILLELTLTATREPKGQKSVDTIQSLLFVCAHVVENYRHVFAEADAPYLKQMIMALAPLLSDTNYCALPSSQSESTDEPENGAQAAPANENSRPFHLIGCLAFSFLRPSMPHIFREFASDCVTLLNDSAEALSYQLNSQQSMMDDGSADITALLAFSSLAEQKDMMIDGATTCVEILIGDIDRSAALVMSSLQLIRYLLERETPVVADLVDGIWSPTLMLLHRLLSTLNEDIVYESVRVLCLLAHFSPCPTIQEDQLVCSILSTLQLFGTNSSSIRLRNASRLLFSSLSLFELREESLNVRANEFIECVQGAIADAQASVDGPQSYDFIDGCLDILALCANASPMSCIRISNVALSCCLLSRNLTPKVIRVLIAAVQSDAASQHRSHSLSLISPYEPPPAKRPRLSTIVRSSVNMQFSESNSVPLSAQQPLSASKTFAELLRVGNGLAFDHSAPVVDIVSRAAALRAIANVAIYLKEWASLQELAPAVERLLGYVASVVTSSRGSFSPLMIDIAVEALRLCEDWLSSNTAETAMPSFLSTLNSVIVAPFEKQDAGHIPNEDCLSFASSEDPRVLLLVDYILSNLNWLPIAEGVEKRKAVILACLCDQRPGVIRLALRHFPFFLQRNGSMLLFDFLAKLKELSGHSDNLLAQAVIFAYGRAACLFSTVEAPVLEQFTCNSEANGRPRLCLPHCPACERREALAQGTDHTKIPVYRFFHSIDDTFRQYRRPMVKALHNAHCTTFAFMQNSRDPATSSSFLIALGRLIQHAVIKPEERDPHVLKLVDTFLSSTEDPPRFACIGTIMAFFYRPEILPMDIEGFRQEVYARLKPLLDVVTDTNAQLSQRTAALDAFGTFACFVDDEGFDLFFQSILEVLFDPSMELRGAALAEIHRICSFKSKSLKDLVMSRKDRIIYRLVMTLNTSPLLDAVAEMMDMTTNQFLEQTLEFALPRLVRSCSKQVIAEIATRLGETPKSLISQKLKVILPYCFLHDFVSPVWEYLRGVLNSNLSVELLENNIPIVKALAFSLGDPKMATKARETLKTCSVYLVPTDLPNPEQALPELLKLAFLELLDDFYRLKLSAVRVELAEKKQALRALGELIKLLLPQNLRSFFIKIIAILKAVMQVTDLREEACNVWLVLLHNLDHGVFDGRLLSDLVVHFTAYLNESENFVVPLFRYLFLQPNTGFHKLFQDIPFMPDKPESLGECIEAYKANTKHLVNPKEQIDRLLKVIGHENAHVRVTALDKLLELVRGQPKLMKTLIDQDPVEQITLDLVEAALAGSGDPHLPARLRFAALLGEIGAIDPARLGVVISTASTNEFSFLGLDDRPTIVHHVISNHLIKFFRSATTPQDQDLASYVIQELLKNQHCNLGSDVPSAYVAESKQFWNRFTGEEQLLIEPFRSSKFFSEADFAAKVRAIPLTTPLYSRKALKYDHWIADWVTRLILCLDSEPAVFHPLIGLLRHDKELCHYLLPHLTVSILLSNTPTSTARREAAAALLQEVMTVIKDPAEAPERRDVNHQATQRVFALLDYLNCWVERVKVEEHSKATKKTGSARKPRDENSKAYPVIAFLNEIDPSLLAEAAVRRKNFARGLQYFEFMAQRMVLNGTIPGIASMCSVAPKGNELRLLHNIYAGLDEPDALAGLSALQTRASLDERLLQYECAGRWVDALNAVDQSLQLADADLDTTRRRHIYRLKCFMNLNLYESALSLVKAQLFEKGVPEAHRQVLRSYGVDAARHLGEWQLVDDFLKQGCQPSFELSVAQILLALKERDEAAFRKYLQTSRLEQMSLLSASMLESYSRAYPIVARLQMLTEVDHAWGTLSPRADNEMKARDSNSLLSEWDFRLKVMLPTFRILEPVLSLRMAICGLGKITGTAVDNSWLRIARYARGEKRFQLAHYALLRVQNQQSNRVQVERAELEKESGYPSDALAEVARVLQTAMEPHPDILNAVLAEKRVSPQGMRPPSQIDPELLAWGEAVLHKFRSIESSGDTPMALTLLNTLTTKLDAWAESHLAMARFLDKYHAEFAKLSEDYSKPVNGVDRKRLCITSIFHYVRALQCDPQNVYPVGPRLLTLWLDFTERFRSSGKPDEKTVSVHKIMHDAIEALPSGIWYNVLPQIIGRVCHPDAATWALLQRIIADKLLKQYPRQVSWHLIAWAKSNRKDRLEKYHKMRDSTTGATRRLLDDAERLGEFLLDVASYDVEENNTVKPPIGTWLLSLRTLIDKINANNRKSSSNRKRSYKFDELRSDLVVPVESQLLRLTEPDSTNFVTIAGFDDEVEVMKSMVKPRRIIIVGSNGEKYSFLAKPKDDLRIDARITDFNTVVNFLLMQDPEGRRRQLLIRTYGVTVLNPECGLLRWVANIKAMRQIIGELYESDGHPVKHISAFMKQQFYEKEPQMQSPALWDELVKRYAKPSVMWRWFVINFPDPSSWYRARLAFCRTAAVMSMVGHILGLGDRHGENILLDKSTGECVHVDLNCAFHKGQNFAVPERVPFRLTHNMVDAMGVTGYNGPFRKAAELTMTTLRKHKETLLSVLDTLVHDTLVEWNSKSKSNEKPVNQDEAQKKARAVLSAVADRLDGIKRDAHNKDDILLPMSVESLVDSLIKDATSSANLCRMYQGWMAFI